MKALYCMSRNTACSHPAHAAAGGRVPVHGVARRLVVMKQVARQQQQVHIVLPRCSQHFFKGCKAVAASDGVQLCKTQMVVRGHQHPNDVTASRARARTHARAGACAHVLERSRQKGEDLDKTGRRAMEHQARCTHSSCSVDAAAMLRARDRAGVHKAAHNAAGLKIDAHTHTVHRRFSATPCTSVWNEYGDTARGRATPAAAGGRSEGGGTAVRQCARAYTVYPRSRWSVPRTPALPTQASLCLHAPTLTPSAAPSTHRRHVGSRAHAAVAGCRRTRPPVRCGCRSLEGACAVYSRAPSLSLTHRARLALARAARTRARTAVGDARSRVHHLH